MQSTAQGLTQPTGAVQVIAISGGKGGVGKTCVSVNLACTLSAQGRRVMLLDGDLGLANVDVFLGLSPRYTMAHVLSGERTLEEVIVQSPQGVQVVPGASGVAELANLSAAGHLSLVQAFSSLSQSVDTLIVDTAAGIAHSVVQFTQAAQHVVLVVCDEPASLTDAYALIKVLSRQHSIGTLKVLANQVRAPGEGRALFEKLQRVATRFLDVTLEYLGEVPEDAYLRRAIREQRPVVSAFPASPASRAFKKLAQQADRWPVPSGPHGNLEFFVERLVSRPAVQLQVAG